MTVIQMVFTAFTVIIGVSALVARKNTNTRYLLGLLFVMQLIDYVACAYAKDVGEVFFIVGVCMSAVIGFTILARKQLARALNMKKEVEAYEFSIQEGMIIVLCFASAALCAITMFEGFLYSHSFNNILIDGYLIDSAPVRAYLYRGSMIFIHGLTTLLAITLALNNQKETQQ